MQRFQEFLGIPIGGELEYVDGTTIARAIEGRIEIDVD